ncbi:hypothetical protein B0H14DRAFT_2873463, partial [Mycena olivaceomarginata]
PVHWIWLLAIGSRVVAIVAELRRIEAQAKLAALNETGYICQSGDDPAAPPRFGPPHQQQVTQQDYDTFDESRSPPFYNYARMFPWARSVEEIAVAFEAASIRASTRRRLMDPCGDLQPLARLLGWLIYILPEGQPQPHDKCWPPGVWRRVSYSAIVACVVQWSCTGSAVLVAWMIPTVGLVASFLLHGSLSMISFTMILAGEIITQCHHTTNPLSIHCHLHRNIRHVNLSALCRRVGKTIAWVKHACFANLFDNAFCSSAVMSRGAHGAFNVIVVEGEGAKPIMIASVAFATTAAFSLWIIVFVL